MKFRYIAQRIEVSEQVLRTRNTLYKRLFPRYGKWFITDNELLTLIRTTDMSTCVMNMKYIGEKVTVNYIDAEFTFDVSPKKYRS